MSHTHNWQLLGCRAESDCVKNGLNVPTFVTGKKGLEKLFRSM